MDLHLHEHECCSCQRRLPCFKCKQCFNEFHRRVYYCSKQCQRDDWANHKPVHNQVVSEGRIEYENAIYTGPILNDTPIGKGHVLYHNGDTFDGFWENERPKKGKFTYLSGAVFDGIFDGQGRRYKGVQLTESGRIFKGVWKDGHFHVGLLTIPDSGTYNGEFKDGLFDGIGTREDPRSGTYTGPWVAGKRHGLSGTLVIGNYKYTGEFKSGHPDGQGRLTTADGVVVKEGNFSKEIWYQL